MTEAENSAIHRRMVNKNSLRSNRELPQVRYECIIYVINKFQFNFLCVVNHVRVLDYPFFSIIPKIPSLNLPFYSRVCWNIKPPCLHFLFRPQRLEMGKVIDILLNIRVNVSLHTL